MQKQDLQKISLLEMDDLLVKGLFAPEVLKVL